MEDSKKTTQHSQAQSGVECAKCHKPVAQNNGQMKNGELLCNDCLAKSKRNKLITACAIIVCCIGAGIAWFYVAGPDRRTALGFDGISEINDSLNIKVDSIKKVEFNLSSAIITSAPISTQAPVSNIEDFKRIVAQNVDAAKSDNTNSLSIPILAVQFGFKSSAISTDAYNLIKEIISLYNQTSKENEIVVEGYACNIGEDAPNDYISHERAEAVKAAFVENGVDASKIKTQWYGKSKNSEFNLLKNEDYRRVLISIK